MSSSYEYLSTGRYYDLSRLEKLGHEWDLGIPRRNIKNLIDVLYINLKFLDMFLSLQSFTTVCSDVTQKVQALFPYAEAEFKRIILPDDVSRVFYKLEEQIWEAKLEIRAKYSFSEVSLPLSSNVATAEFVRRFIDTVVINLSDLPEICNPYSWYPLAPCSSRQQMEEVVKELKLLGNLIRCTDPQSQTFNGRVLVVAGHAAMIFWLNASFSDLQMRIQPIQPCIRFYIDVLQALKSGWHPNTQAEHAADYEIGYVEILVHRLEELTKHKDIVSFKNQMNLPREALQEMLNFLRANLINLPREALEDFDTAIIDIGLLVYSLCDSMEEKEDMAVGELNQVPVLDFSGSIQSIRAVIYRITRKSFQSFLPKIDGLGSIDIILDHLKELLSRYSDSLSSIRIQLQTIQQQLEHFQNQDDGFKSFAMQVIAKAYEMEHIVVSCINKDIPEWCLVHWTGGIIEEITLLMTEVDEIHEKKVSDLVLHNTTDVASAHTSQFDRNTSMREEMVGFDEVVNKLRQQLIRGSSDLDVISIVGMAGLGKTTLASKLYHDHTVVSRFDVRAQCCVSQAYTRKDLLLTILRGVEKDAVISEKLPENELADKLRKLLLVNRYLILVDDVWEPTAWDDLWPCFFDANNGSRIILTTRLGDVASHAKLISDPHFLRLFTPEESWMLLKNKVFNTKSCPLVLKDIGTKIAQRCGGLPLSVVLVAVFLEDEEIQVSKLTWLWTAEGFVKTHKEKLSEEIAENYLKNLIGRNLIMVSKKSSDGKIKACRIHDLLLDFCKNKAQVENFLQYVKGDNGHMNPSISHQKHSILRRLCLYSLGDNLSKWISICSDVQSFHLMKSRQIALSSMDNASYTFNSFKFLRVLDLEFAVIDSFPETLTCLRYVAVRVAEDSSLSFSSNLWNLETLIVKGIGGRVSLPDTLWKMVKLRHLRIYNRAVFTIPNVHEELLESPPKMDNLRTLASAWFSCEEDANQILAKTPNLQKLRCEVPKYKMFFPAFNNLTKLEMLKFYGGYLSPRATKLPPSLKKLTLSNCYLSNLNQVATLPRLVVLKLVQVTIYSEVWEVNDEQFLQLKLLKLDNPSFSEWDASGDAFPCLERLELKRWRHLKNFPSRFEDASSLKSVVIISCNDALARSAMAAKETLIDISGTSGFEVFIRK